MQSYTTQPMTGKQADEFIAAFDAAIGTETETNQDGDQFTVTCFELVTGETAKAKRIEANIRASVSVNEDLSTEQHAQQISESVINGQNKQALDQFKRALSESCDAGALLADIAEQIGAGRALIHIAAAYIKNPA